MCSWIGGGIINARWTNKEGKKTGLFKQSLYVLTAAPHCIAELMPSTHKLGQPGNAKDRTIHAGRLVVLQKMSMQEKGETLNQQPRLNTKV